MKQNVFNTISPSEQRDIIEGLHAGKEGAIHKLYSLHYPALCYYAEKLIQRKAEAQDIATDAFLKLLKRKNDFHHLGAVRSFLFTTTRNACIDHLRMTKRHEQGHRQLSYVTSPEESFGEDEMILAKVLQAIYVGIDSLPIQCQKVFRSFFIEGKNTATIATEMGLSPQTVLNQKTKAIRILREVLLKGGLYPAGMVIISLSIPLC